MALREVLRTKHNCIHRCNEQACERPNTEECNNLPDCKYGNRYSCIFRNKPTPDEIEEYITMLDIKFELAQEETRIRKAKLFAKHNDHGQLISIMLDKDYKQIPELMGDILNELKCYKDITENDAVASVEIEGENGYNPHIHVAVRKVKAPSALAQPLYLKFVADKNGKRREKWQCYRISVDDMPYGAASKYVYGEKTSDEKKEKCKIDQKWRIENSMKSVYHINPK